MHTSGREALRETKSVSVGQVFRETPLQLSLKLERKNKISAVWHAKLRDICTTAGHAYKSRLLLEILIRDKVCPSENESKSGQVEGKFLFVEL